MEKIKELLLLEDKHLLHRELPRIRKMVNEYKAEVTKIFETGGNSVEISRALDPFFEIESLHKKVIDILEPK